MSQKQNLNDMINMTVRVKDFCDIFYYIDRNIFPVKGTPFQMNIQSSCRSFFLSNFLGELLFCSNYLSFFSKFIRLDREYSENWHVWLMQAYLVDCVEIRHQE